MSAMKIYKISILILSGLISACATLDPRRADIVLEETRPMSNITTYTQALEDLGMMTEIYGAPPLKIQCTPVGDNTGSSLASGAEIPRDVTEMMKSVLNSIGGRVVFIPYDPAFMQNTAGTGYFPESFSKVIPDAILSGGITEFDRGLVTQGKNIDLSGQAEFPGLSDNFPTKGVNFNASGGKKFGLSRITLDFNLLDLETMTGIPKMNVVNTMEVRKGMNEKELAIGLFGQTFGLKGSMKRVQGRHAAVRLLVELSMIQMVGKHLRLPYWKLLGPDAKPDPAVLNQISEYFRCLSPREALANVQEWLFLYGYKTKVTGKWDDETKRALSEINLKFDPKSSQIDLDTFTSVYVNIPVTPEQVAKRHQLENSGRRKS